MHGAKPSLLSGEDLLAKHIAEAVRVIAVEIHVDPDTLDRLFIVHSEDREPFCLRVEPVDLATILRSLNEAITKSMN